MRLILLNGCPGSGKSTLAAELHKHYKSPWFEFGWIPEFRRLNPYTEISYDEEAEISFENLILVVGNYLNHGYDNIIISDLSNDKIISFADAFPEYDKVIVTLWCSDEDIRKRVCNRDNGNEYRNADEAVKINHEILNRAIRENEIRINSGEYSAEQISGIIDGICGKGL